MTEVFEPAEATTHTIAADTTKLRELWARFANKAIDQGFPRDTAINLANMAVKGAIRRRKRKGRRR